MLLLGIHQFFNSLFPLTTTRSLVEEAKNFISQGIYNLTILQVCLCNVVGITTFSILFDQQKLRKETILEYKATFRQMVSTWDSGMILLGIHRNMLYHVIEGDKEHEVTCPKCCVNIEIYKLIIGLRQTPLLPYLIAYVIIVDKASRSFFLIA